MHFAPNKAGAHDHSAACPIGRHPRADAQRRIGRREIGGYNVTTNKYSLQINNACHFDPFWMCIATEFRSNDSQDIPVKEGEYLDNVWFDDGLLKEKQVIEKYS